MQLKADHYTSLVRAVAGLERDCYETRGAVYDRALISLIERLHTANPPLAQADIDKEVLAFRQAVRRVEFGDLDDLDWLAQRSEPAAAPPPAASWRPSRDAPAAPPAAALGAGVRPSANTRARGRRSVLGRIVSRAAIAAALIAVGLAGYAYATGQFELASLTRLFDRLAAWDWPGTSGGGITGAPAAERAAYYDQADPQKVLAGKALWRTRVDAGGRERKPVTVLTLDVQIPESGFSLAMSMRRDASEQPVMSHLIEFEFAGSKDFPVDGISGVTGINLKSADDKRTALVGLSIKVAPGLFLFGLSADKEEARRNAELLRTQPRLEIPIVFADGRTRIIAADKGASGERAIEDAFNAWAK